MPDLGFSWKRSFQTMPGLGGFIFAVSSYGIQKAKAHQSAEESNANQSAQDVPNRSLPEDPFFCASAVFQPMTPRHVRFLLNQCSCCLLFAPIEEAVGKERKLESTLFSIFLHLASSTIMTDCSKNEGGTRSLTQFTNQSVGLGMSISGQPPSLCCSQLPQQCWQCFAFERGE